MLLENLIPTHNELRNIETYKFFRDKMLDNEPKIFQISKRIKVIEMVEDGIRYIWDGHHFLSAAFNCGFLSLNDSLFELKIYSYEDIINMNLTNGYVTPFDPKCECRLADFLDFKNEVLNEKNDWYKSFMILSQPYRYKELRKVKTLKELCNKYNEI